MLYINKSFFLKVRKAFKPICGWGFEGQGGVQRGNDEDTVWARVEVKKSGVFQRDKKNGVFQEPKVQILKSHGHFLKTKSQMDPNIQNTQEPRIYL